MSRILQRAFVVTIALSLVLSSFSLAFADIQARPLAAPNAVTATILHTNDFHGNLQLAGSNPGSARVAQKVQDVLADPAAGTVLLVDAGDIMQGTLLSNLFHGESTIDIYNQMGYDVATFGNHEFDWGKTVLEERVTQADFPFVSANIVVNDTGDCATAGWTSPAFATPWVTMTVGTAPDTAVVGLIGVTSQETPYITIASATEGLCFKDPAASILQHYDALDAEADAIVVLSHLGYTDGGYGYGLVVYGDQTLAQKLIDAGKPADLIIGGHSHTNMVTSGGPAVIGSTIVTQAYYAGRQVGKATLVIDPVADSVAVTWTPIIVGTADPEDAAIATAVAGWASDPWYQDQINRVVGYTNVDIVRNYNGDSLMGAFINDAIYNDLNTDAEPLNDADIVFNNAGGLRADIVIPAGSTLPYTLTHGILYSVLPFGNQTVVGDMTGTQILDLLNQSATLFKGALQLSGARYSFYRYADALPGGSPWAWGAFDIEVKNPDTGFFEPLDLDRVYRVATNEFLAPAGQDGFVPFKYMTNISYWGDMLDGVERWVAEAYPTTSPFMGARDGRVNREGTDAGGPIVPVTLLFHGDSHGNLLQSGSYPGLSQLATLVTQERAHNPERTLLLNTGDTIQGDAMSYFFKSAALGYSADGTPLDPALQIQPSIAVMNHMGYDAMTLGNHEFNFGSAVFTSTLGAANFPILQANVYDDGSYGLDEVPVEPSTIITLTGPSGVIDVAILGIGNHRVPSYELPSNIPGLTFTNPISEALDRVPYLEATNDVVVALTHIGFTGNPSSVEVDDNVDTNLAAQTAGIDAILGGHSHTDPSKQTPYSGDYKYLPAFVGGSDNEPVIVHHAYRYNNYLGEVVLGLRAFDSRGSVDYEVVARVGRALKVDAETAVTPETTPADPAVVAIVQPYADLLADYNATELGETTVPISATTAYIEETNGANLQADAALWELEVHNGIAVDFHLSGAMSNRQVAASATEATPVMLTVADMFTLMPYENSLVVMEMNGPQLKAVLERSYRNWYYYNYVPEAGGYSYYTTCFLDTNAGNQIVYRDAYPTLPDGNNVKSLDIGGVPIDFANATTFYRVSTVNYLAAGACNYSDAGTTLWPLGQIVEDTQLYVRDAVINYIMAETPPPIAPTVEGRIVFQEPFFWYLPFITRNAN
ncbi:MAG TPA: 5'-nucleotidase C-terminal domain-containing protein [Anaerolineae bacterium]|nr:5'-nucleotidase C-terminal domain-containing protein [Anaerolineae bacterium]